MKKYSTSPHHQENANQNHNEVPPHIHQDGHYQKNKWKISVGQEGEDTGTLVHAGSNAKWCNHNVKQYSGSSRN